MHSIILKIMDEKYLLIIFFSKIIEFWNSEHYVGITKLPIKQLRVLNISN